MSELVVNDTCEIVTLLFQGNSVQLDVKYLFQALNFLCVSWANLLITNNSSIFYCVRVCENVYPTATVIGAGKQASQLKRLTATLVYVGKSSVLDIGQVLHWQNY